MKPKNKTIRTMRRLISDAKMFVSGKTTKRQKSELYESILESVNFLARSKRTTIKQFEKMRADKRKRNGGFQKGYILSEKILPITKGVLQDKIIRDDKRDTVSGAQKTIAKTSLEGIRPIPEKLVRDNIPAIIENQAKKNWEYACKRTALKEKIAFNEAKKHHHPLKNYKTKIRVADQQELLDWLKRKLQEEIVELQASVKKKDFLEDLGDILEIIEVYRYHQSRI